MREENQITWRSPRTKGALPFRYGVRRMNSGQLPVMRRNRACDRCLEIGMEPWEPTGIRPRRKLSAAFSTSCPRCHAPKRQADTAQGHLGAVDREAAPSQEILSSSFPCMVKAGMWDPVWQMFPHRCIGLGEAKTSPKLVTLWMGLGGISVCCLGHPLPQSRIDSNQNFYTGTCLACFFVYLFVCFKSLVVKNPYSP